MNDVNNIIKKKKWYKRKWPYIVLVIVLLAGGIAYSQYKKSIQPPQYETVKVLRGTLIQTVEATGNVEASNELDLRFGTAGRIARFYKQVNDQVKKGDLVAELDLTGLQAQVAQAKAAVDQAEANLNKLLAGNTASYLDGLQASLDQAKANLQQVEGTTPGVENSQAVQNAYTDAAALLLSVQNSLSGALTQADNILGMDNTLANISFKDYLSALDGSKLNIAKGKYLDAKLAKQNFDDLMISLSKTSDHSSIDNAVLVGENSLASMKDLLVAVSEVLDKTAPVSVLNQTNLDLMKSSIQSSRVDISAKNISLLNSVHTIETARTSYSYASYKALVDRAEAALQDAKNPPRQADVNSLQAAVEQAKANLAVVLANRSLAQIISPVDGIVGKSDHKVGEYVGPTEAVVNIVNPHFNIRVDIPETDIIKISVNDQAQIKLDAYGDDVKFAGTVVQIEKGQTVIQDVVYYKVTVALGNNDKYQILNGMTANVTFSTEKKDNVLYIPQRAVHTNSGKYVKVLENSQVNDVEIKLGLKGDGGMVEVTTGLQEGQVIVLGTVTK